MFSAFQAIGLVLFPARFSAGRHSRYGWLPGKGRLILLALAILYSGATIPAPASAGESAEIDRLLAQGGFLITRGDTVVASRNADQLLVPASTWKIATALAALRILGPDFRFETRFFVDRDRNLYIQGLGDPFLTSEEVSLIMKGLKGKVNEIRDIVLDDSSFRLTRAADGAGSSLNPYDVANGALAVNFNTVNLRVTGRGSVESAEPQTPTLPLMKELGAGLPPGTHRLNISTDQKQILRHVGELFRACQQAERIPGKGAIRPGRVPLGLAPAHVHPSSRDLPGIIRGLMLYSNNFIANQLFLTCGARRLGYPATWDKGREVLASFLQQELALPPDAAQVEEGSGLSRRNRITPRAMARLLTAFRPHADLLPLANGRLLKSGTLTGVYAYAGYFRNEDKLDGVVLILNQEKNHRDRLLDLLEELYKAPALHAQAE